MKGTVGTLPVRPASYCWRLARLVASASLWAVGLACMWALPAAPNADAAGVAPGQVVAWGDNEFHQTDVPAAAKTGVTQVAGGCGHGLALKSGTVIAWGDDQSGETDVPAAAKSGVVAISAGCAFSLALKSNGTIVAWGADRYQETDVPSLPAGYRYYALGADDEWAVALATDGKHTLLVDWGSGTQSEVQTAAAVNCEAGHHAWVLLRKNGTVAVGGNGDIGQWEAPAFTDVTAIAAGRAHVLVLFSDGGIGAWGDDEYGQIDSPIGLNDAIQVAARGDHSLALTADGRIFGWGENEHGEGSAPPPPAGSHYTFVAAGNHFSLAIASPNLPKAPTDVTATPLDGAAAVSWSAPEPNGASVIRSYTVTSSPDGKKCTSNGAFTCTVSGLTNGTAYTFTVSASNAAGTGPASAASAPVIPALVPTPSPVPTPPPPTLTASPQTPSPVVTVAPSPSPPPAGGSGPAPTPIAIAAILGLIGLGTAAAVIGVYRSGRLGSRRFGGETPPTDPADPDAHPATADHPT
jgi:hypothetical protein